MSIQSREVQKRYDNAVEAYAIYDVAQIGEDVEGVAGYSSYSALAGPAKIPFFNVRNQGEVGLAYNNLDTKDSMPFVFHCYTLGVAFAAPTQVVESVGPDGSGQNNATANAQFVQAIPYHCGLRLKIRQDEKLLHTVHFAPEGAGPYGMAFGLDISQGPAGLDNVLGLTSQTQGEPLLTNRWPFPKGISIPRGATYTVELEFSEHAKRMLNAMPGPGNYRFRTEQGETLVPAHSLIRVSMFGAREVQQRNELTA